MVKENGEGEIEEQVSNFKEGVKKDQNCLNKAFGSTSSDIKNKINIVSQELKDVKKSRKQSNKSLMGLLQQARVKFDQVTERQRRKRSQYDSIVLGLLDRTVEQGERLMRRIG